MTSSLANQASELNEDILLMKAEGNDIECITFRHQIILPVTKKRNQYRMTSSWIHTISVFVNVSPMSALSIEKNKYL